MLDQNVDGAVKIKWDIMNSTLRPYILANAAIKLKALVGSWAPGLRVAVKNDRANTATNARGDDIHLDDQEDLHTRQSSNTIAVDVQTVSSRAGPTSQAPRPARSVSSA